MPGIQNPNTKKHRFQHLFYWSNESIALLPVSPSSICFNDCLPFSLLLWVAVADETCLGHGICKQTTTYKYPLSCAYIDSQQHFYELVCTLAKVHTVERLGLFRFYISTLPYETTAFCSSTPKQNAQNPFRDTTSRREWIIYAADNQKKYTYMELCFTRYTVNNLKNDHWEQFTTKRLLIIRTIKLHTCSCLCGSTKQQRDLQRRIAGAVHSTYDNPYAVRTIPVWSMGNPYYASTEKKYFFSTQVQLLRSAIRGQKFPHTTSLGEEIPRK